MLRALSDDVMYNMTCCDILRSRWYSIYNRARSLTINRTAGIRLHQLLFVSSINVRAVARTCIINHSWYYFLLPCPQKAVFTTYSSLVSRSLPLRHWACSRGACVLIYSLLFYCDDIYEYLRRVRNDGAVLSRYRQRTCGPQRAWRFKRALHLAAKTMKPSGHTRSYSVLSWLYSARTILDRTITFGVTIVPLSRDVRSTRRVGCLERFCSTS